jgi:hypothetical protein
MVVIVVHNPFIYVTKALYDFLSLLIKVTNFLKIQLLKQKTPAVLLTGADRPDLSIPSMKQ